MGIGVIVRNLVGRWLMRLDTLKDRRGINLRRILRGYRLCQVSLYRSWPGLLVWSQVFMLLGLFILGGSRRSVIKVSNKEHQMELLRDFLHYVKKHHPKVWDEYARKHFAAHFLKKQFLSRNHILFLFLPLLFHVFLSPFISKGSVLKFSFSFSFEFSYDLSHD